MRRRSFLRSTLAAVAAPALLPADIWAAPRTTHSARRAEPIRLSSNENPLGLPESAKRAITDALADGHRYPRLNATVAARIAEVNGVAPANVVLGNGSAEILQMTVQALTARGEGVRVILPDPTFEQVERYASVMGAQLVKVPLLADHTHDIARMQREVAASRGPVLVFICNPNNPTGTVTPCNDLAQWIRSAPEHVWFLVDEAYLEFVNDPSFRAFVPEATSRPNTLVCRTFSKIYALAGVRLGYGIAHADTVRRVREFAAGTNINHLAAAAGLACLDDTGFVRRSLDVNRKGLEFAYATLDGLGIPYLRSHANFIMHRVNGDLGAYITRMREANILVGRAFPPMLDHNRVSIGLPEEMEVWAGTLRAFRAKGWV